MTPVPVENHHFLVQAPTEITARRVVDRFLDRNNLVRYDSYQYLAVRGGHDLARGNLLDDMVAENTARMRGICARLAEEGFVSLDSLIGIRPGYVNKLFHTLAHLVDGFFGIDTFFYNLVEDSHYVSPSLRRQIHDAPEGFWLLGIEARLDAGGGGKGFHLI